MSGQQQGAGESRPQTQQPRIFAIAVRGNDHRGPFNLQSEVGAQSAMAALDLALVRWAIDEGALVRVHVQLAGEKGPDQ